MISKETNMQYLLIDIDDTLSITPEHKSIAEFHKLNHKNFKPKKEIIDIINDMLGDTLLHPMFITSRCESLLSNTDYWLNQHLNLKDKKYTLCMRYYDNFESPADLKLLQLHHRTIRPKQVRLWVDDDADTIQKASAAGFNIMHPNAVKEFYD